jgi:hypothetical protein
MYPRQLETLKYLVDQKSPTIPFYVCTIKNSSTLDGKSRMVNNYCILKDMFFHIYLLTIMTSSEQSFAFYNLQYFTRRFTLKYILRNMNLPDDHLVVSCNGQSCENVRIIMGKGRDSGAMITTNWRAVVQKSNMKDQDIFVFWFRIRSRPSGGLKLYVWNLEK